MADPEIPSAAVQAAARAIWAATIAAKDSADDDALDVELWPVLARAALAAAWPHLAARDTLTGSGAHDGTDGGS